MLARAASSLCLLTHLIRPTLHHALECNTYESLSYGSGPLCSAERRSPSSTHVRIELTSRALGARKEKGLLLTLSKDQGFVCQNLRCRCRMQVRQGHIDQASRLPGCV